MNNPIEQGDDATLEAEVRRSLQHQAAAYERMRETQRELDALVRRARELIARVSDRAKVAPAREGKGG